MKQNIKATTNNRTAIVRYPYRISLKLLTLIAFSLGFMVPPAYAVTSWTYSTVCNENNTVWTITTVCTVDSGGGPIIVTQPSKLHVGVQFSPSANSPTATLTDTDGNPVRVGGAVVTLVPSAVLTTKVTDRFGTITPLHVWKAFETSVDLPGFVGDATNRFIISFVFPTSVLPNGGTWLSDDSASRYGATVVDAYALIPLSNPIPTVSEWGFIILSLLMLTIGTVFILRHRAPALSATNSAS